MKRQMARAAAALGLLLATVGTVLAAEPAAATAPIPWRQGQSVSVWQVDAVLHSAEFLRLDLHGPDGLAGVEIVLDPDAAGTWAAPPYRVQPSPQRASNEPCLLAVRDDLRRWLGEGPKARFLQPHRVPAASEPRDARMPEPEPREASSLRSLRAKSTGHLALAALGLTVPDLWAGAHCIATALAWLLAGFWGRRQRADRLPLAVCALATLGGIVALWFWLPPARLPASWLTMLQEGPTRQNLAHLYGMGVHGGEAWRGFFIWIAERNADARPGLWLNLAFAWCNLVVVATLTWLHTRSALGLVFVTLAACCNLAVLHAAFSELPSLLLALGFWQGFAACAVLSLPELPAPWRRLALTELVWVTVLAAESRSEAALPGCLVLLWEWSGTGRPARVRADLLAALGRVWQRLRISPLRAIALLAVWESLRLAVGVVVPAYWSWSLAALDPLNPTAATLPQALAAVAPLGAVLLVLAGLVAAFRGSPHVQLLGLALLALYKLYFSASHAVFFELQRYMTLLTGPLAWFAMSGWRAADAAFARWPWAGRGVGQTALLASFFVWLPHGNLAQYLPTARLQHADSAPATGDPWLLSRDVQREVRFVQAAVDAEPDCVFVTRFATQVDGVRGPETFIAFGEPLPGPRFGPAEGVSLAQFVAASQPQRCWRYYRGLSCNLVGTPPCARDEPGLARVASRTFAAAPYNDAAEYGESRPEVELAVFRIPVAAAIH